MFELGPMFRQQFFDSNGDPLAAGLLFTYAAGTSTPQATYTDSSGDTPSTNPIVLDSAGTCQFWVGPSAYKFVLEDSLGNVVDTADNVTSPNASSPYLKTTMTFAQFTALSLSQSVAAFSLPAGNILTGLIIKHSTPFTGSSITAVLAEIGTTGSPDQFIGDYNVFQSASDTVFDNTVTGFIGSFINPTSIFLTLTATGANLNALSTGSVDIYYQYQPFIT